MNDSSAASFMNGAVFNGLCAFLSSIAGLFLLVKKDKALRYIGMLLVTVFLFACSYLYLIPHFLKILQNPELIRILSASLFTLLSAVAVYKLAQGAVYVLLAFLIGPLTYELLGHLWQLSPSKEWEQAKLVFALSVAVFLSTFLLQHLQVTAKALSVIFGSILISASVQYFFDTETYFGVIDKCMGTPDLGWDASECLPFYSSGLLSILITGLWYLFVAVQGNQTAPVYQVPIPRKSRESSSVPYVDIDQVHKELETASAPV